jgi:hypothetical protein
VIFAGHQVAHFDRALELDDMLAITFFQRGVCYFMTGDYTSAMADWEQTETVRVQFGFSCAGFLLGAGCAHRLAGN